MKRTLIFGTGSTGYRIYMEIKDTVEVIGFLDNDESKWGQTVDGVKILGNAESISGIEYDEVLICSLPGLNIIREQLINAGIPLTKINSSFIEVQVLARLNFLRDYALSCVYKDDDTYAVAEGGVYQGEFAKEINKAFPKQTIYLFDTFEGFDSRDIKEEHSKNFSSLQEKHLAIESETLVVEKLLYPDKAVVRKGYFPDSAQNMEERKYIFVNLDFDLYRPTLEGLEYFYPRLVSGCCILIHDYYNPGYKGVAQAVKEFEEKNEKIVKVPIGDHCSIAIIKA